METTSINNSEKEAVVILSYANSEDKIELLRECIYNAKKSGYKIILSSGFQLPEDIQNDVDYALFDKENPIITGDDLNKIGGAIFFWIKYPQFENSHCVDMNHSYAVLKLMKNAAGIAKMINVEKLHYLNYDYIIYDSDLFKKQSDSLKENDLYYYYHLENENFMNTGIFSIKTDFMLDCFKNINNKSDFCDQKLPILEEFMLKVFKEKNLKKERELLQDIKQNNKIDVIATANFLISKKINDIDYNLFLYLSKDDKDGRYYIICKSDIKSNLKLTIEKEELDTIDISEYPRVIEISEDLIQKGIKVEVPEFEHKEFFNLNKKLSSCNIIDYSIIENINSFNRIILTEEETIQNDEIQNNESGVKSFYDLSMINGTDKVYYHGYHFFYTSHFEKFRFEDFKMLEIGYGDGASMKTWSDYFPNADITVMDINVELKYSNRCRVIKGDQSNQKDINNIVSILKKAKLIIDDGSHNPIHQFDTFNHLFQNLLEPGGIYIIEDIELSYWNPESTLYGYKSGHFNLIDSFKRYQEMINSEFSGVKNYLDISKIEFGQNCIIITKRTAEEKNYFDRNYRFVDCINGVCHFAQPEINENYNFDVYERSLHDIGKKLGTDKSEHLFTVVYDSKLGHLKNSKIKFLEIGLWLGSSIRMWSEYFKNASIYGADLLNEQEMKEHVSKINQSQNLNLEVNWGSNFNFIKLNQENEYELLNLDDDFDIIIEDGGHTMYQQQLSLKILIDKIKSGGYLIIEDVHTSNLVYNYSASSQIYGSNEFNNTLSLLIDLKNKKIKNNQYHINEVEFHELVGKIDEIEIIKTQIDSILCIIKKN